MLLESFLKKRYSTKLFQNKKIPQDIWQQMEEALRFSASSTNLQPWHFIIADSKAGKERLTKGTVDYPFNTSKILGSSHVVLFCAKLDAQEPYLLKVLNQEGEDGRFHDEKSKDGVHQVRKLFVDLHHSEMNDFQHWAEKQVYLNVGNALLGAAVLGLDAVPMEGININALNTDFHLKEKGLSAVVMVAFGYGDDKDFNAKLPKSRLPKSEILTKI